MIFFQVLMGAFELYTLWPELSAGSMLFSRIAFVLCACMPNTLWPELSAWRVSISVAVSFVQGLCACFV